MNLVGKGVVHEKAFQVFSAVPGSDIEFLIGCKLCGMISEATITTHHPCMGSLKLVYRCPQCQKPGELVLSIIEETR